jgi:hypothetical protein
MKDILLGFASKALNLDNEQLAELLYKKSDDGKLTEETSPDAIDKLLEAHVAHVAKIKGEGGGKDRFNDGHAAGKKEALSQLEDRLRREFKVDSKATGIDLVKEVVSAFAKAEASEEKIKVHPLFLKIESDFAAKEEAMRAEYEGRIKAKEDEYGRKDRFSTVAQPKILEEFAKLNPVLPTNPKAAANHQMEFLKRFQRYDFEALQTGEVLVKLPDGTRVETEHGHPAKLSDLVRQQAEMLYDFAQQGEKGNSGNNNAGGAGGGRPQGQKYNFKNEEDFADRYYKEPDLSKRVEMSDEYYATGG